MTIGSSGWMFPYVVPDYEFSGYVYKNVNGQWRSQTLEETFNESDIPNIWDGYVTNYIVCLFKDYGKKMF